MFKKTTLVLGALALMLVASQAQAAKGDWMINFNGGTSVPMSDFKDAAKLGFMGGVGADYMVAEAFAVGVDGSYVKNGGSDDFNAALTAAATAIEGTPTTVTAKFSMIQGGAHAKYIFPMADESKVSPYVVAGAGIYNLKGKTESSNATYAGDAPGQNKFGGHGGLGVMFKASGNVSIGAEGQFHHIATDGTATQYVSLQAAVSVGMSQPK
jgi:opacity protein-like surface antigen